MNGRVAGRKLNSEEIMNLRTVIKEIFSSLSLGLEDLDIRVHEDKDLYSFQGSFKYGNLKDTKTFIAYQVVGPGGVVHGVPFLSRAAAEAWKTSDCIIVELSGMATPPPKGEVAMEESS